MNVVTYIWSMMMRFSRVVLDCFFFLCLLAPLSHAEVLSTTSSDNNKTPQQPAEVLDTVIISSDNKPPQQPVEPAPLPPKLDPMPPSTAIKKSELPLNNSIQKPKQNPPWSPSFGIGASVLPVYLSWNPPLSDGLYLAGVELNLLFPIHRYVTFETSLSSMFRGLSNGLLGIAKLSVGPRVYFLPHNEYSGKSSIRISPYGLAGASYEVFWVRLYESGSSGGYAGLGVYLGAGVEVQLRKHIALNFDLTGNTNWELFPKLRTMPGVSLRVRLGFSYYF